MNVYTKILSATAITLLIAPAPAFASLTIKLDGDATSSLVAITLSGESTATLNVNGNQYLMSMGWQFDPQSYDPFPAAISISGWGIYPFASGSAIFENLTKGWSMQVSGVWLQDSSNSAIPGLERFGFSMSDNYQFDVGDAFRLTGNGTIDLAPSGLVFRDLAIGSTGEVCAFGLCGDLQISAVPEPSVIAMWLFGGACLLANRARRKRHERV
jgi:hypothetical protein